MPDHVRWLEREAPDLAPVPHLSIRRLAIAMLPEYSRPAGREPNEQWPPFFRNVLIDVDRSRRGLRLRATEVARTRMVAGPGLEPGTYGL